MSVQIIFSSANCIVCNSIIEKRNIVYHQEYCLCFKEMDILEYYNKDCISFGKMLLYERNLKFHWLHILGFISYLGKLNVSD